MICSNPQSVQEKQDKMEKSQDLDAKDPNCVANVSELLRMNSGKLKENNVLKFMTCDLLDALNSLLSIQGDQSSKKSDETIEELNLLFLLLDAFFVAIYTDYCTSKEVLIRLLEVLASSDYLARIPQDQYTYEWDQVKGVRKGIYVLGVCLGCLTVSTLMQIDVDIDLVQYARLDVVDASNAVVGLTIGVYQGLHALKQAIDISAACVDLVARSLASGLEWIADALNSYWAQPEKYPNALGLRSVYKDVLFGLLTVFETIPKEHFVLLAECIGLVHSGQEELCEILWTEELVVFRPFLSLLLSTMFPADPECVLNLLSRCIGGAVSAVQVIEVLSVLPLLPLPRTPDRMYVAEELIGDRLLLQVTRQLYIQTPGAVGFILREGTTGSQSSEQLQIVEWNVEWSGWEWIIRALEHEFMTPSIVQVLGKLAKYSSLGFLANPKVNPLFEQTLGMEISCVFVLLTRRGLDTNALYLNALLAVLAKTINQKYVGLLAEMDILSERGLLQVPPNSPYCKNLFELCHSCMLLDCPAVALKICNFVFHFQPIPGSEYLGALGLLLCDIPDSEEKQKYCDQVKILELLLSGDISNQACLGLLCVLDSTVPYVTPEQTLKLLEHLPETRKVLIKLLPTTPLDPNCTSALKEYILQENVDFELLGTLLQGKPEIFQQLGSNAGVLDRISAALVPVNDQSVDFLHKFLEKPAQSGLLKALEGNQDLSSSLLDYLSSPQSNKKRDAVQILSVLTTKLVNEQWAIELIQKEPELADSVLQCVKASVKVLEAALTTQLTYGVIQSIVKRDLSGIVVDEGMVSRWMIQPGLADLISALGRSKHYLGILPQIPLDQAAQHVDLILVILKNYPPGPAEDLKAIMKSGLLPVFLSKPFLQSSLLLELSESLFRELLNMGLLEAAASETKPSQLYKLLSRASSYDADRIVAILHSTNALDHDLFDSSKCNFDDAYALLDLVGHCVSHSSMSVSAKKYLNHKVPLLVLSILKRILLDDMHEEERLCVLGLALLHEFKCVCPQNILERLKEWKRGEWKILSFI